MHGVRTHIAVMLNGPLGMFTTYRTGVKCHGTTQYQSQCTLHTVVVAEGITRESLSLLCLKRVRDKSLQTSRKEDNLPVRKILNFRLSSEVPRLTDIYASYSTPYSEMNGLNL